MKNAFKIYHDTLHGVIAEVENNITGNGYALPLSFNQLGYWQAVSYGTTARYNEALETVKGKQGISFQIYRMDNGNYELNLYYWN